MRYASVAMALMALCLSTNAFAGANPQVTLPLHAKPSSFEPCTGYLPVDCVSTLPTTNVAAVPIAVFLFVYNHHNVAGVQTAFEWPGWNFLFGQWTCQGGQLFAVAPANPGGPTAGTITTAFNCVNTTELLIVGNMHFVPAGTPGCISQVQSTFPNGIHVLDCAQGTDLISTSPQDQLRLGKICVGQAGNAACTPVSAVEPSTWGSIKASYN
jgi:hypothetical protein